MNSSREKYLISDDFDTSVRNTLGQYSELKNGKNLNSHNHGHENRKIVAFKIFERTLTIEEGESSQHPAANQTFYMQIILAVVLGARNHPLIEVATP